MAEKADRGLAAAAEETGSSFHQRKKQKSGPSARPLMLPRTRLQRLKPSGGGGSGVLPNRAPWSLGTQGSWTPLSPSIVFQLPNRVAGWSSEAALPQPGPLQVTPCTSHPTRLTRSLMSPHPPCLP